MNILIGIALKSLLVAGLSLGFLQLMRRRSAAERSWVAHIGLLALVIMALAPLALPSWNVETPAMFARTAEGQTVAQPLPPAASNAISSGSLAVRKLPAARPVSSLPILSSAAVATALYAVPAAILLFITFLALARLVALRARADVLVDGHWLSALARAQRRMGFKHGTALLTSDELASPISWGLMRPVILLNSRAVEATDEAEAIIAHELAHVARMDWVKLLLARIATALFWFNPVVWILAREAHQLREEAADDSVLAADIVDTDYAQLLVGVARHECPGLLLGAHGVAPSKSSLARRVARVLDGKSVRGPVARSFALGVLAGAILVAAPLAALTLTPGVSRQTRAPSSRLAASEPAAAYYSQGQEVPTDLPRIIAKGVSTSVQTAMAAVRPSTARSDGSFQMASRGAMLDSENGTLSSRSADGASVVIYPADSNGRRKMVARSANGVTSVSYVGADGVHAKDVAGSRYRDRSIDVAIEAKATGVTPEYIAAMRAAAPRLAGLDFSEFSGLRTLDVTPEFARGMVTSGFPSISADQLMQARSVGLNGDYVRAMRAAGIQGSLEDFIELRTVGIDPGFAARVKSSGIKVTRADDLVELKALGISRPPAPPHPPARPSRKGLPAASPPDWDAPGPGG